MKSGMFHVPYNEPQRTPRQVFDWAVRSAVEADRFGFRDFTLGEHATQAWEAIPNPELVIAAAARETTNLHFAPTAHLLPLHNPASLAIQVGWLSQILEGRYFLGIAPGAFPRDALIRGLPTDMSEARPRMKEALEIMERIWKREPFEYRGKFFNGGYPATTGPEAEGDPNLLPDFSPWGGAGGLEIAVNGISPESATIRIAGERGWSPTTDFGGLEIMKSHWKVYSEAAEEAGNTPDRSRWRCVRDIFVAETDAEAKRLAINGPLGTSWSRYVGPIFQRFGLFQGFIDDSGIDIDAADIDLEFMAEHVWVCGSADTVTEKLEHMIDETGGFGMIGMKAHDALDDPAPWFEAMERFATEVVPRLPDPAPAEVAPPALGGK